MTVISLLFQNYGNPIFASWWWFHGELLVNPSTQAQLPFALLLAIVMRDVHNDREVRR